MKINWYPGHMHKARKEIGKLMPSVDLLIEVLDARIPFSSSNPVVCSLGKHKPCIKVLNKSDLADRLCTQEWQRVLEQEQAVRTLVTSSKDVHTIQAIMPLAEKLLPQCNRTDRPVRALIVGIPNVGKSTLINRLANRTIAKTGNQPALTRAQQRIRLRNGMVLYDTPGFLWPRLEPQVCAYRLAVTGAIKNSVLEFEDIALFLLEYLLEHHPDVLLQRYAMETLPDDATALFGQVGRQRGGMRRGGCLDSRKTAEIIINDLHSGSFGPLSFETPAMIASQLATEEHCCEPQEEFS